MSAPDTIAGPGFSNRKIAVICGLLAGLVFVVFGQSLGFGYVYDDFLYLADNPLVQNGLTFKGVVSTFTYQQDDYWHPLVWITHMLDRQLYGSWTGGNHLTNVILHAASVVLLFLALLQMTGATWRSAFVAAVWAIHPLRAESVAWITERKDVLSGLFFMLALGAYIRWVRWPSAIRKVVMLAVFAMGLMSKNMLVTFPCVLLLLDYWPLRRMGELSSFPKLLREKIPFFILSIGSCVFTFFLPYDLTSTHEISAPLRFQNAIISYCIYLRQSFWPAALSPNYPIPSHPYALWQVMAAALLLGLLTLAAFLFRSRQPWILIGWLWFLGMLTPVIGLVQISHYSHADRYTYLPQIGLLIAGTWMIADFSSRWPKRELLLGTLAATVICCLSMAAGRQVSYWRDSYALWSHALDCNPEDAVAHNDLGYDLFKEGRVEEAIDHYHKTLQLDPTYAITRNNLGNALKSQGKTDEAIVQFRQALVINPYFAEAQDNIGSALAAAGRTEEAAVAYGKAVRLKPDSAGFRNNLGNALLQLRRTDEAISRFREALKIDPDYAEAHNNLGNALVQRKEVPQAIAEYREALRLRPSYANAHYNLGTTLLRVGAGGEAMRETEEALKLEPGNATYQNALALLLAMAPRASMRDGPRALELASAANKSAGGKDPLFLRTLAAAQAETGDFPHAVETAHKAISLLQGPSNASMATELQRELALYEAGKRFEGGHPMK